MYLKLRWAVVLDSMLFVLFGFLGFSFVATTESRALLNFHPSLFFFAFFLMGILISTILTKMLKLPEYEDSRWNVGCSYFFGSGLYILFNISFSLTSLGILLIGLVLYVVFLLSTVQDVVKNIEDLP